MKIREARQEDIPKMREVFDYGRQIQLETGNLNQWAAGYPAEELIREDIAKGAAHICLNEEDEIVGVFSVFIEPDPTYAEIDGAWLNEEPYATIHRIAVNGKARGVGQYCIKWIQERFDNVRIDTHENNQPMIHVVNKLGFEYCGVIYLANGDPRNAYQFTR